MNGGAAETRAADAGFGLNSNYRGLAGSFSLVAAPEGDPKNARSTAFLRPEDGAWDTKNRNRYYFVTTDQADAAKGGNANPDAFTGGTLAGTPLVGRTRLWALTFKDSSQPELGGTIEMLLDGTRDKGDYQMFDNLTVNKDGTIILQEDVGNNQHNGKMRKFNPDTGTMVKLAGFDPALFGDIGRTGSLTKDEESSGVIEITDILQRGDGRVYNLLVAQSHAPSGDPETVEGGQLILMSLPR